MENEKPVEALISFRARSVKEACRILGDMQISPEDVTIMRIHAPEQMEEEDSFVDLSGIEEIDFEKFYAEDGNDGECVQWLGDEQDIADYMDELEDLTAGALGIEKTEKDPLMMS